MARNFAISLLLLGLLAAGVDGFRTRERLVTSPDGASTVRTAEGGMMAPPPM